MSVSIKYKGTEIASASTETTKTIKTAGKYCEADILVENTPDGGDAPVINPLSVTANGTYTAPSGVDGYSPVTVNVPQGITPTGNINITDTNVTDVTNYATATVVDADLIASNIKKDVNILGVVGSFEGGGGGGLPSTMMDVVRIGFEKFIEGKSFTTVEFTNVSSGNNITIQHSLGYAPTTIVMFPIELLNDTVDTNYYQVGICTNPADQASDTNNTHRLFVTTQPGGLRWDAIRALQTAVGNKLPISVFQNGQFTFITSSTATQFTIRNGSAASNALQSGKYMVAFK